ncbi:chitin synthase-domain-containing protein [Phycomyces nitens]|nr:chitin synthase-domain-containing protein [Phycomyces nitens]
MPTRYDPASGGNTPGDEYAYRATESNYRYNAGAASVGRTPTTLGRAPTRRMAPGGNSIANASQNIQRGRTLIRPDRYQEPAPLLTGKTTSSGTMFDPWTFFSRVVTFWALSPMLKALGMPDASMQQAWREKITLCFLIACMGGFVAFITIGLSSVLCPPTDASNQQNYLSYNDSINGASLLGINGWQFNITNAKNTGNTDFFSLAKTPGTDITSLFQHGTTIPACQDTGNPVSTKFAAVSFNPCTGGTCTLGSLSQATYDSLGIFNSTRQVGYDWTHLAGDDLTNFFVIDGNVLNLTPYIKSNPNVLPDDELDVLIRYILKQDFAEGGRDATKLFFRLPELEASIDCMVEKYRAGKIDKDTPGCFVASIILFCSLFIVLSIVFARFFMALIFSWFISRKLSRTPPAMPRISPVAAAGAAIRPNQTMEMSAISPSAPLMSGGSNPSAMTRLMEIGNDLYSVMLITCYSENTEGIRGTVESLAATDYPDDRKLLFLIADGIITGHGETMSTPDMCLSLITFDDPAMRNPEPKAYMAVASGAKQHNCAKVYAVCSGHKVPMILVVKSGNPGEQGKPKPGNRGKRDSQLILMNFFSRVTYNDRMTPLDFELFQKITYLMKVTPDYFELVLMVDADTKVYESSLRLLINCMVNDNLIMGLCGETKIANKRDSWVTAIQVYEYFISHHLAKGFEAVFGGVTCLPGCFCMYRLKARKGDGDWIPIITKPEIVQEYSSNTIDTLHQKNLLLLGEDRFLTTLMLRNFPFRKMVFTPQAICKTVVPDEFKVLLSQRRRWINSTIHNLFELVLVRNLCGTFCFSMQFVVMMDLVGTLTLPVAIVLTVVLVVSMAKTHITSFTLAVPLILLIIVLFSPAFLILVTTRKWVYLAWMIVYLFALPIWNFVLPVYAFWHFDDFSWGETRKVEGEAKGDDHSKTDGVFDPASVPLKRWEDYERKRVRAKKRRERNERDLGPTHQIHTIIDEEDSQFGTFDDNISNLSFNGGSGNVQDPAHYFDPSKEAPAKNGTGYYPSYRPQSQAPLPSRPIAPVQPHPTAPGPWGPQQNFTPSSPNSNSRPMQPSSAPLGPGQYVGAQQHNPGPYNQGPYQGF